MSIPNVKIEIDYNLQGLQIGPNGYVSREITYLDYTRFWYSRQFETSSRGEDNSLGIDTTLYNGKKLFSKYASTKCLDAIYMPLKVKEYRQKYARLLQITHEIQGTALSLSLARALYARYKAHQLQWANINLAFQKLQDPEVTIDIKNDLVSYLEDIITHPDTPVYVKRNSMALKIDGITYFVFFTEGQSYELNLWPTGDFCDFKFKLVEYAPFEEATV